MAVKGIGWGFDSMEVWESSSGLIGDGEMGMARFGIGSDGGEGMDGLDCYDDDGMEMGWIGSNR